jgi:hypothetical protein
LFAGLYANDAFATVVTVNATLPVFLGIPALDTAQRPLALVVQEPVLPPLQVPLTVAVASAPWLPV